MARCRAGLFALVAVLAGSTEATAAADRADTSSCDAPLTLFHAGRIRFCAKKAPGPAETITYQASGAGLAAYQGDLDTVIQTATCITRARFVVAEHGRLHIEIGSDSEPNRPGPHLTSVSHGARPGSNRASLFLNARSPADPDIGAALQAFVWATLGMAKPRLLPPASEMDGPARMDLIGGATRVCAFRKTLWRRGDMGFCRPRNLPKIVRYAIVGSVAEYGDAIEGSIRSVAQLTGVRLEASKEPDVILLFPTTADKPEQLVEVLRRLGITPSKGLAPAIASTTFASGGPWGLYGGAGRLDQMWSLQLHHQPMIDVAEDVETRLLDVLDVDRPAFSLPAECL